jgi:hypothetical protein
MKIESEQDYIDSLSKNNIDQYKELKKALVLKKKIAFARNNSFRGYYL